MEHLHPDDAAAQLQNILASLAPGGVYICITPNRWSGPHDVSRYFDEEATGFHLHEYTVGELALMFREVGFRSVEALVGSGGAHIRTPAVVISSLERLLEMLRDIPGVEVLGCAEDGLHAINSIRSLKPDAVVLDIQMPRGTGLDGLRVTIVGDVLHSRVARSNVLLLSTLGAEVTLAAPPTLLPLAVGSWPCAVSYDLDSELSKSDGVMMLRVQQERMSAAYFPSVREYSRRYGLDAARMARLPGHAIVMHPGPMNRGVEIAAEVADSVRSTIVEQVANGVTTRMAVLYLLLGGTEFPATGVAR